MTRPSTTERGYDRQHFRDRARWQRRINAGETVRCRRGPACVFAEILDDLSIVGGVITGTEWDLGHDDRDRSLPAHPEHRRCNRQTNGRGGSRKRPQEPHPGMI